MKEKMVEWLACPACSGDLRLVAFEMEDNAQSAASDVKSGVLVCKCGSVYPIIDGVPRVIEGALVASTDFVRVWKKNLAEADALNDKALHPPSREFAKFIEPTLKRFEKEWSEHKIEETTWGLDQKTRLRSILSYMDWTPEQIKGKLVLDAGAGTGQLTCSLATLGCEVVGVDLSPAVARGQHARKTYAGNRQDYVHFVQGDLMNPPFKKNVFDGIISSGVLHHTPDTKKAFTAIAPLTKIGGVLAVWLYKAGTEDVFIPILPFITSSWNHLKGSSMRNVTTKMPPGLLYGSIWVYSLIFHILYKANAIARGRDHKQTVRERTTSLFDSLAPPYAWKHTPEEVTEWFEENGYHHVKDTSVPIDEIASGFCMAAIRKT